MPTNSIVVTGANGFLGRNAARTLSSKGYEVLGLGHGEWAKEEWSLWGLSRWQSSDVTLETILDLGTVPSTIIHCAGGGSVAFSIEEPLSDFDRTVSTTAHVLEFVRRYAPKCRIVYPSSASVYGTVEQIPIGEDCKTAPISQYGVHKLMAEQLIQSYGRQFGTIASIVRFFSVYGPGLRKQLLWDACRKFSAGDFTFMGSGQEVRDWLHVDDATELMAVAMGKSSHECPVVNGGSGQGVTVSDLLAHLGNCLDVEGHKKPCFSGAQRPGDPSRYVANTDASRAWGWVPKVGWERGVCQYAEWWKRISK